MGKRILITGVNGFIGTHLSRKLYDEGHYVVGVDWIRYNNWVSDQRWQYRKLHRYSQLSIEYSANLAKILSDEKIDIVMHLAAETGVLESFSHPQKYIETNISGFLSVLQAMLASNVKNLIYASSSSVYGGFSGLGEDSELSCPRSVYAVTKKTDELLAKVYSLQFGLNCVGLRFFTVYGEYGRRDMFPYICANKILKEEEVPLRGDGFMQRDFTYVGDVCEAISRIVKKEFPSNVIYNIGGGNPVSVQVFANKLADKLGKQLKTKLVESSFKEDYRTSADSSYFDVVYGKVDYTPLNAGLEKYAKWLLENESDCVNDIIS